MTISLIHVKLGPRPYLMAKSQYNVYALFSALGCPEKRLPYVRASTQVMLKCLFVPVTEIVLSDILLYFFNIILFLPTPTVIIILLQRPAVHQHKQEVDLWQC